MLYGIGDGLLTKLQTVQSAAARVVTRTRKFDHITSLASGPPANHLQTSDDHLQVPPWSGAVILGRCVHPGLVCCRQVAAAVGKQWGTRRAAHKDHDRSEGLCRGWPDHLEQPPRRPTVFITVQRYICEKTRNTFIWLQALLRSSLIGRYTNWHIHSFIQCTGCVTTGADVCRAGA